MMLFKLRHDEDIFALNPELAAIKEFEQLTPVQMTAVALIADYGSPLRSLPDKDRRAKAAEIAGYGMEGTRLNRNGRSIVYGEVASVERAIKKYREIQYDEDKAMLEAIESQIQEAMELMAMDKKEACRISKVTTKKDGTSTSEEYIDSVAAVKLASEAIKLGTRLHELKETKAKLLAIINKDETQLGITTYTSADISLDETAEDKSTLDLFMEKDGTK
jgi:hypothetical protein